MTQPVFPFSFWGTINLFSNIGITNLQRCDVVALIYNASQLLLTASSGMAVIFIIIGGYKYIISTGNEDAMNQAKATITSALIGFFIVLVAKALIFEILNVIGANTATSCGY